MSRLQQLLDLRTAIDNEIATERQSLKRYRELTERVVTSTNHGNWNTRAFNAVTSSSGITGDQILSRARTHDVVEARHLAMWLMRQGGTSYPKIAAEFDVDHSSVMNACRRVEANRTLAARGARLHRLMSEAEAA